MRRFVVLSIVFGLSAGLLWASPKEGEGTPSAKVEFEKGESAVRTGEFLKASGYFRKAILIDADYVDAHQSFVTYRLVGAVREGMKVWDASRGAHSPVQVGSARAEHELELKNVERSSLITQYQQWSKIHPKRAVYKWVLGYLNEQRDFQLAEKYYRDTLALDPAFARAYTSLSTLLETNGDLDGARSVLRQAVEAMPNDAAILFYYAATFRLVDPAEYERLSMKLLERFPESERAPQALYWLALYAGSEERKVELLEAVRAKFPPARFGPWASAAMVLLFDVYDHNDREKALGLAEQMMKADPGNRTWSQRASYAKAMLGAERLIANGNPADALKTLDTVRVPRRIDRQTFELLHARAVDAMGNSDRAYHDLLVAFGPTPSDDLRAGLEAYGRKLGKDRKQVEEDAWEIRRTAARAAKSFSLQNYSTGKPVSLADLKGQVLLLNFWYPQCGPCRGEFPFLKAVSEKYKNQGFKIVAVNVHPEEDEYVLPLLKSHGLEFIPLKGDTQWAEKSYEVVGEPTNFLIGTDGRIYFGPLGPIDTPRGQRTLELQIEALLKSGHQSLAH